MGEGFGVRGKTRDHPLTPSPLRLDELHRALDEDVLEAYELHRIQDAGAVKIVIDMEG